MAVPLSSTEADRARLRSPSANAMAGCFLSVLRHERLEFGFGALVVKDAQRVAQKTGQASAHELEPFMSTMRSASTRGPGASMPWGRGISPVCTQRQNRRSAVMRKCWDRASAGMVISIHLPPP